MFITLEGIEGVGKSTQAQRLKTWLHSRGIATVLSREPGGTPVAESIRNLLKEAPSGSISSLCELLLIFAARQSHADQVLRPALSKGQWVLCDRFVDASFAYQGGGRGLPDSYIEQLARWTVPDLNPDLTLLLDLPVSQAMARVPLRGQPDRFEREARSFFERTRKTYHRLASDAPERIHIIDASLDRDTVEQQCRQVIEQRLFTHA